MLCVILGAQLCSFLYNILENFSTILMLSPLKESLPVANHMNSGVDCHKHPKGYRYVQKAGTVRHVFQFDKHERRKDTIHFNVESQRDILLEMSRTKGHDEVDYIYNS